MTSKKRSKPAPVPEAAAQSEAEKDALEALIQRVKVAQEKFANYTQQQVDKIFAAAALAANEQRIPLAKMAVEDTGMGVLEDKVIKNNYAAEYILNKYRNDVTCGIIEEDDAFGIIKVAEPRGILAGIIPTTNPTSTVIFKSLLALKTRNAIIFSPHPRATRCTIAAAKIVLDAAVKAGAPEDIIGWIENPSIELSAYLMRHKDTALILATGGPGMVKAAYSSGNPAVGVGAGNDPVVIDDTADIRMAVSSIIMSKTFDNGMICASEQSVTAMSSIYEAVKQEFAYRGAYFLKPAEIDKVGRVIQIEKNGVPNINPAVVGQSAQTIAEMAGVKVPPGTKILVGEIDGVGPDVPLSREKLSPVLALYKRDTYEECLANAKELLAYGGLGHTAVLYTNTQNEKRIRDFGHQVYASRVLINTPASQGGIGDLYNFGLPPSLTLGCGSWGGNSVSENVGVKHLVNIKTIAKRRENMLWFKVPEKVYFKYGCLCTALDDLAGKKRAFIVTDKFIFDSGMMQPMLDKLRAMNIKVHIFPDVKPDPSIQTAKTALALMKSFEPDVIIAMGGGSPMDCAKIMWFMYEQPDVAFADIAQRFMDIRKRVVQVPKLGTKAMLVCIPTTAGTGSEVTPFAVITDEETQVKYPITDYCFTPNMAIIDTELVMKLPKSLTAISGIDALTHALESRVSLMASDYNNALSNEAARLIFEYLPRCYKNGAMDEEAREHMFNAAAMAGMAFANAFLGICHSIAHKLGGMYHVPHGLANALCINEVIRFNSAEAPAKQGAFPQYHYPNARHDYAMVARHVGLKGKDDAELVEALISKINTLKKELDIPENLKVWLDAHGVSEETFLANLDDLATKAFDDQCTGANPRYPLINELKQVILNCYYGNTKKGQIRK